MDHTRCMHLAFTGYSSWSSNCFRGSSANHFQLVILICLAPHFHIFSVGWKRKSRQRRSGRSWRSRGKLLWRFRSLWQVELVKWYKRLHGRIFWIRQERENQIWLLRREADRPDERSIRWKVVHQLEIRSSTAKNIARKRKAKSDCRSQRGRRPESYIATVQYKQSQGTIL